MPKSVTRFTLVISSPSDMRADRDAVEEAIAEINSDPSLGVVVEVKRWERDVFPDVASDPQAVVNQQLMGEYDVLIGLIGGKLGTPTPRAESGTAEEILHALKKSKPASVHHDVQVYFKRVQVVLLEADTMEIDRIQKFRRALGSQGVFYADYDTLPQLQRLVRETTRRCILSWLATSATEVPAADQVTPREEEEEELGILDYMETFETGFRGANDNLSQAIAYLNEFTDFVRAKALAMASLKDSRASDKKKAINEFAHRMSDDAAKIHKSLKAASSKSSEALTALAAALSLQPADMLPRDEALKLLHAMDSLISSAEGAVEKTAGLGLAITQLPRMTAEFNRAKREMLEATDFFRVISAEIIARGTQIKEQLERFSMHNS